MRTRSEKALYIRIGELIKSRREFLKMSVYECAKQSGVARSTIVRMEEGHGFQFHHVLWLREVLSIDIEKAIKSFDIKKSDINVEFDLRRMHQNTKRKVQYHESNKYVDDLI